MYRPFLLIILSLFLFLSCDHNPKNNIVINSTDSNVSLENNKELTGKFVFRKLEDSLNYDYSRADFDLERLTEENIYAYEKKDQLKDYDALLWHYIHYKAKYWFDSGKKIYHYIDPNEFFKQNDRFTLPNKYNYYVLKETKECYSLRIRRYSHPKYAALHALRAYGHQRWRSLSFKQVPHNYGQYCCVWMSDTKKKKENRGYGTRYYLEDEEAEEVLNTNKEYYLDCILFLRDNIVCEVSCFNHIPQKAEYNLYDFAREVDEFIQKQPTVDELKPATLQLSFENFNVDTYNWEPSKGMLQAAFIDEDSEYAQEVEKYLYNKIRIDLGVFDENGKKIPDIDEATKEKVWKTEEYIERPLRLSYEIVDQLGNKGGSASVVAAFKGCSDAKLPEQLSIEAFENIEKEEDKKNIDYDDRSWCCGLEYYFEHLDDNSSEVYIGLTPGRYIIVIDVETSSMVKSRHFYEMYLTNEHWSKDVKDFIEQLEEKKKAEEKKRLAEEAAEAAEEAAEAKADVEWEKNNGDKVSRSKEDWDDW